MANASNIVLNFDGQNDRVTIGTANELGLINSSFTVEAWVKIENIGPDRPIIGVHKGLVFMTRGRRIYLAFYGNDTISNINLQQDEWYHIAFRYDLEKQEQAIFVNGILDKAEQGHAAYTHDGPVFIGHGHGTPQHFKGSITELRFWDHALSQKNIQEKLYERLRGDESGLTAYYPLNEGRGGLAHAKNTPRHPGRIFGATWAKDNSTTLFPRVLELAEKNSYVELSPESLPSGNEITISFWARGGDGMSKVSRFLSAVDQEGGILLLIHLPIKDNIVTFSCGFEGDKANMDILTLEFEDPSIFYHQWNHWTFTKNAETGEMKIYLNGDLMGEEKSKKGSINPNCVSMRLGALASVFQGKPRDFWKGHITELTMWSKALSSHEINNIIGKKLTGKEDGLVSYLPFSHVDEGEFISDMTGKSGIGGSLKGGSQIVDFNSDPLSFTSFPFTKDSFLSFDGTNDHVDLKGLSQAPLEFSNGLTIEVWAYFESFNKWSRIIDIGNGEAQQNILFANEATLNDLVFEFYTPDHSQKIRARNILKLHTWMHLVARVMPDGSASLFVNAKKVTEGTLDLPQSILYENWYVGKSAWSHDEYFKGGMSELRLWERGLTGVEIKRRMNQRLSGLEEGLIGYWPFNGGRGNFAKDHLIYGNDHPSGQTDGEIQGATWTSDDSLGFCMPVPSSAVTTFQGGHIRLADKNQYKITGPITLEAWVKPASIHNEGIKIVEELPGIKRRPIISRMGVNEGWELIATQEGVQFSLGFKTGISTIRYHDDMTEGLWYHVVGVYNGREQSIYINGVKKISKSVNGQTILYSGVPFIGCNAHDNSLHYQGNMAELRIWSKGLSELEIKQHVFQPLTGKEPSLVAYFRMDESFFEQKNIDKLATFFIRDSSIFREDAITNQVIPSEGNTPVLNRGAFSENIYSRGIDSAFALVESLRSEMNMLGEANKVLTDENKVLNSTKDSVDAVLESENIQLKKELARHNELIGTLKEQISELNLLKNDEKAEKKILLKEFILRTQNSIKNAQAELVNDQSGYQLKDVEMTLKVLPINQGEGIKFPEGDDSIDSGQLSTMNFTFSPGSTIKEREVKPIIVPDLHGLTDIMARRKLAALGFRVNQNTQAVHEDSNSKVKMIGRVVNQIPAKNTEAPFGTIVTVFIGKKS